MSSSMGPCSHSGRGVGQDTAELVRDMSAYTMLCLDACLVKFLVLTKHSLVLCRAPEPSFLVCVAVVNDGIKADGHQRDSVHSAGGEGHRGPGHHH